MIDICIEDIESIINQYWTNTGVESAKLSFKPFIRNDNLRNLI